MKDGRALYLALRVIEEGKEVRWNRVDEGNGETGPMAYSYRALRLGSLMLVEGPNGSIWLEWPVKSDDEMEMYYGGHAELYSSTFGTKNDMVREICRRFKHRFGQRDLFTENFPGGGSLESRQERIASLKAYRGRPYDPYKLKF